MNQEEEVYESGSILPKRMNEPPVVFRGCTAMETAFIVLGSFLFWIVTGAIAGFFLGGGWILVSLSFILTGLSTYGLASYLRQMKKGRPSGFYAQEWRRRFAMLGLTRTYLFSYDGPMTLGRTKQYIDHDIEEEAVRDAPVRRPVVIAPPRTEPAPEPLTPA